MEHIPLIPGYGVGPGANSSAQCVLRFLRTSDMADLMGNIMRCEADMMNTYEYYTVRDNFGDNMGYNIYNYNMVYGCLWDNSNTTIETYGIIMDNRV